MNTIASIRLRVSRPSTPSTSRRYCSALLGAVFCALAVAGNSPGARSHEHPRTWPQAYTVSRDDAAGLLTLNTPYFTVEQDVRRGGAITRIALTHGRSANLLARPVETRVRDADGHILSDLYDDAPTVAHQTDGLREIVTVESTLRDSLGRASQIRVRTTLRYGWGYVKITKELLAPPGTHVREVSPITTVLSPTLTDYGYREGITEDEGSAPFSFGSNRWGRLRFDHADDPPLETRFVPRSMIFVDPGIEGLEWFRGSDLTQWDLQLTGQRGRGQCRLDRSQDPLGLALSVSPLWSPDAAERLPDGAIFDFYVAFPILDGHAHQPWLHTGFNRNRGDWVSTDTIKRWAERGIQTVHCHNDGDYYEDGLFWRDGAYPPYPDMDRYDQVLTDCRAAGIRTATYFSNKELHSSTQEFQDHGRHWGRMNRAGDLQRNLFRADSEFGYQMCLRSGWLDFLKLSIDRVLTNHPLDGVYYDWNVALDCRNPLHEARGDHEVAQGHWDMDELLDLMEWTRQRVGRDGLVIIHNTTTPMFALENFADHVVATEWGYGKWTDQAPDMHQLPLETSLAGAVSRGAISYGVLDSDAPRRLHRQFAIQTLLNGVTPWPASDEILDLMPRLTPLGNVQDYRFADWRNRAVSLSHPRCAAAVYSRPGESYLLLANLDAEAREVTCVLDPQQLPHPLDRPASASQLDATDPDKSRMLDVGSLIGEGISLVLPGDDVILVRVREDRPNIVVFLVDDMGVMDTSVPFLTDATGQPIRYPLNEFYRTPSMERLAAQGMRFNQFCAMSVCSPTRISILTGQNAARHRTTNWINPDQDNAGPQGPPQWNWRGLTSGDVTLPALLQQAGYRTIHIGKGHFGPRQFAGGEPLNLGFDVNVAGGSFGAPGSYYAAKNYRQSATNLSHAVPHLEAYHGSDVFLTEALTLEAKRCLEEAVQADRPFFLHFSHYALHAPFESDPRFAPHYTDSGKPPQAQAFATLIEGMDKSLGDLLDHLEKLGVADNTLIFFLGDNGSDAPLGHQHEVACAAPLRGRKGSHYEGGMRVPFIAAWAKPDPDNPHQQRLPIRTGAIQGQQASVADLFPTILTLLDIDMPPGHFVDGHPLDTLLGGDADPHRPESFLMHYPHAPHRSDYWTSYREGPWKVIYHYVPSVASDNSHYQLFRLDRDPFEQENLSASEPDELRRMVHGLIEALERHDALYPVDANGSALRPTLP